MAGRLVRARRRRARPTRPGTSIWPTTFTWCHSTASAEHSPPRPGRTPTRLLRRTGGGWRSSASTIRGCIRRTCVSASLDLATGERRWISTALDRTFEATGAGTRIRWDGDDVLAIGEDRGDARVYRMAADGAGHRNRSHPPAALAKSFDLARGHAGRVRSVRSSVPTSCTSPTNGATLERVTAVSRTGSSPGPGLARPSGSSRRRPTASRSTAGSSRRPTWRTACATRCC